MPGAERDVLQDLPHRVHPAHRTSLHNSIGSDAACSSWLALRACWRRPVACAARSRSVVGAAPLFDQDFAKSVFQFRGIRLRGLEFQGLIVTTPMLIGLLKPLRPVPRH